MIREMTLEEYRENLQVAVDELARKCKEITRLRAMVEKQGNALRELADSSKYMLFGVDCPGGAHVGWMAYGRPDKIARAALQKK